MPKLEPSSSKPGFPCFEPHCQRHTNPYRTIFGLQKHLEYVLRYFPDRHSKRGSEARNHNVNRVLRELKLDNPEMIEGPWEVAEERFQDAEGENEDYSAEEELEDDEEEEDEDDEDEVVEIIPQRLLRVPEASSADIIPNSGGTSVQRYTHKRSTPNPTATHDHRHTHRSPNETIDTSRGLGQGYPGSREQDSYRNTFDDGRSRGDTRKPAGAGRREGGKVGDTRSRSTRFKRTPVEAEAGDGHASQRTIPKVGASTHSLILKKTLLHPMNRMYLANSIIQAPNIYPPQLLACWRRVENS